MSTQKRKSEVELRIDMQGGPIVNCGYVHHAGRDVAAVEIDMKSKHCAVSMTGSSDDIPLVMLSPTERSLHLTQGKDAEPTAICFPGFYGWDIFCAEVSRYTLLICFVRQAECSTTCWRTDDE